MASTAIVPTDITFFERLIPSILAGIKVITIRMKQKATINQTLLLIYYLMNMALIMESYKLFLYHP